MLSAVCKVVPAEPVAQRRQVRRSLPNREVSYDVSHGNHENVCEGGRQRAGVSAREPQNYAVTGDPGWSSERPDMAREGRPSHHRGGEQVADVRAVSRSPATCSFHEEVRVGEAGGQIAWTGPCREGS